MIQERIDRRHHLAARLPELPCTQRQGKRQRRRRTAAEADVRRELLAFVECDVLDEEPQHALTFAIGSRSGLPERREIARQRQEARALRIVEDGVVGLPLALVFFLRLGQRPQSAVPFRLELVGHEAVVGIDLHEAPAREVGFVPRPLHVAPAQPIRLVGARLELLLDRERRLQRPWRPGLAPEPSPGAVEVGAGDALADRLAAGDALPLAGVGRERLAATVVVPDGHALAAASADHQALQQRGSFAGWAAAAVGALGLRVVAEAPLNVLKLLPRDVARVRIRDERGPLLAREPLERAGAITMPALTAPAKEESAGEARIVQDPERARVLELSPDDLPLGRSRPRAPRKGEPLRAEGLHRRGRRAGPPEGREEEADGFLDLLVGIEDHAGVRVVAEADRQRRLELAAARLVENAAPQPRPQDMQL